MSITHSITSLIKHLSYRATNNNRPNLELDVYDGLSDPTGLDILEDATFGIVNIDAPAWYPCADFRFSVQRSFRIRCYI
jgi:hypothetical protein